MSIRTLAVIAAKIARIRGCLIDVHALCSRLALKFENEDRLIEQHDDVRDRLASSGSWYSRTGAKWRAEGKMRQEFPSLVLEDRHGVVEARICSNEASLNEAAQRRLQHKGADTSRNRGMVDDQPA